MKLLIINKKNFPIQLYYKDSLLIITVATLGESSFVKLIFKTFPIIIFTNIQNFILMRGAQKLASLHLSNSCFAIWSLVLNLAQHLYDDKVEQRCIHIIYLQQPLLRNNWPTRTRVLKSKFEQPAEAWLSLTCWTKYIRRRYSTGKKYERNGNVFGKVDLFISRVFFTYNPT